MEHVLRECPVYDTALELEILLGERYLRSLVQSIILLEQGFILGCKNWDRYALLKLVKLGY